MRQLRFIFIAFLTSLSVTNATILRKTLAVLLFSILSFDSIGFYGFMNQGGKADAVTPKGNTKKQAAASQSNDSIAGKWSSDWGPVEFNSNLTGQWNQGVGIGQIKDGTYDPKTRKLVFHYYQPWNDMDGTVTLTLSEDGGQLSGVWTQQRGSNPIGSGGSGGWTMKRSTPAQPIHDQKKPQKIVDIFVSGFSSNLFGGDTKHYEERFQDKHPDIICKYHSWDDENGILNDINTAPKDAIIRIIGHSYGGDTSAKVVGEATRHIDTLILVDPVSQIPVADYPTQSNKRIGNTTKPLPPTWEQRVTERIQKAKNNVTGQFIDLDAMPGKNEGFPDVVSYVGNKVAFIGGKWDRLPDRKVSIFIPDSHNRSHTDYEKMVTDPQPQLGGKSLIDLMAKPISQ